MVETLFESVVSAINPINSVVETLAIIAAGWWTYRLFVKNRKNYPFARLEHKIEHYELDEHYIYISLIVYITNSGNVLLNLRQGTIIVQQVLPIRESILAQIKEISRDNLHEGNDEDIFKTDGAVAWHEIGFRQLRWGEKEIVIEPGECQEVAYDFIVTGPVKVVRVTSYFRNETQKEPEIGWTHTSVCDLKEN